MGGGGGGRAPGAPAPPYFVTVVITGSGAHPPPPHNFERLHIYCEKHTSFIALFSRSHCLLTRASAQFVMLIAVFCASYGRHGMCY